jgi:alcohol dehydrogenase class IV
MFDAPHGAICAAILPSGMRANIEALRTGNPQSPILERYATIARIVTANPQAAPEDGAQWVASLARQLAIPSLAAYGIGTRDIPALVEKAARASSMKANPVVLTPAGAGN